jgi:hypothetical protein
MISFVSRCSIPSSDPRAGVVIAKKCKRRMIRGAERGVQGNCEEALP